MSELEEITHLLSLATYPGVISALKQHEATVIATNQAEDNQKSSNESSSEQQESPEVEDLLPPAPQQPSVQLKQDIRIAAPLQSKDRIVYSPITDFAWDQSGYDSPIITVYIDLDGVGSVRDKVKIDFTKSSFDLQVIGLNGKNYRLIKDNLDKDILPDKSKILVKKNKIVVKLHKVKGQYSYESWTNLTSKKTAEKRNQVNKDPSSGIMDMMKDMYDDGDENMKKIIGEAMLKSKSGEKMDTPPMPDMGGM